MFGTYFLAKIQGARHPEVVEPRNNNQTCAMHHLASSDCVGVEIGKNLKSSQRWFKKVKNRKSKHVVIICDVVLPRKNAKHIWCTGTFEGESYTKFGTMLLVLLPT